MEEYFPVKFKAGTITGIEEIRHNGSGDIKAALFADGLGIHPAEISELKENDSVEIIL